MYITSKINKDKNNNAKKKKKDLNSWNYIDEYL